MFEPIDLTVVDVTTVHPSLTKAACMKAMHLVRADGRVDVGYDAGHARPLDPLVLAARADRLATDSFLGRPQGLQCNSGLRPRDVVCTDDACGIHPLHPWPEAGRAPS